MSYEDLRVFTGPRGQLCASIAGINLHSQIDPQREAQRICKNPPASTADAVIVFGLGLGYAVEALCSGNPQRPVILVEPEADWINQAVSLRQQANQALDLAGHPGLMVVRCQHPDDLIMALQELGSRNPALVANAAIVKIRQGEFELAQQAVAAYKERFQVNVNTLQRFGKLWVRNLARNLDYMATCPGINAFANIFQGKPGLLVAGGPSLDLVLPKLGQLRQRCVMVAVDTSLRACLQAGFDPDFVVMVDPQYWNTRHLDGCRHSKARVVSESSIYPRSLRQTGGLVHLCSSLFPLGQYFESIVGTKGSLGAGGSVATTAWDFLRFLGIKEIFTAGLDLSFPGGQTHFHGSVFEEASHRDSSRLKPASGIRYSYLYGGGSYLCRSSGGQAVLSDQRMDIYVHWFENQVRQHPELKNRRIGSGSRHIEGFGEFPLDELIKAPEIRSEIDQALGQADDQTMEHIQLHRASGLANLNIGRRQLCQELINLQTIARDTLSLLDAISAQAKPDQQILAQQLCQLDAYDAAVLGSGNRRIVGFLIEEIIQEISVAEQAKNLEQSLQSSRKLYAALLEACDYHLELFAKDD